MDPNPLVDPNPQMDPNPLLDLNQRLVAALMALFIGNLTFLDLIHDF